MKHRILLLFSCLLCLVGITKAQDLEPGQQAQGYLDSKNITVDYSTGIFHYKIPLFQLKSGNVQLPISLNYTSRGVKEMDVAGILGYNWNLDVGGVVMRTIRGGFADEYLFNGYLWADENPGALPLVEDIRGVNIRNRDGESDIFTAVFNGQSVSFIIEMDANKKIYAIPLERTNVKIECVSKDGMEIKGWIITDEDGNRYTYMQQEWSTNINKEDAITFNGIRGRYYLSAWHINKIEPCNGGAILFNYFEDVICSDRQSSVNRTIYSACYWSKYGYGKPMREHPFDFSKYSSKYNSAMSTARSYVGQLLSEMHLNSQIFEYVRHGEWVRRPTISQNNFIKNYRIMGMLGNISSISSVSNDLVQTLIQLESYYRGQSSNAAQNAAHYIGKAKDYIIESLREVNDVTSKETFGGIGYTILTPLLKDITCMDKIIEFYYQGLDGSKYISNIRQCDLVKKRISEVHVERNVDQLCRLSFLDKDSNEISQLKFDYYTRPQDVALIPDIWGYPKRKLNKDGEQYMPEVDETYSKIGSMKTITLFDGGRILIDYESNRVINRNMADVDDVDNWLEYGGIRIKSLILADNIGCSFDTIYYSYPFPGLLVYDDFFNKELIRYESFSDTITHSQVKFKGNAFLNTGNNGLYYRYVNETIVGKGTKAYLFHVPVRYPISLLTRLPYTFWLNGLLLATASYDTKGNLKQIMKNKYYTDMSFNTETSLGELPFMIFFDDNIDYFEAGDTILGYKYKKEQLQAYDYYMDMEYLSSYYKNLDDKQLYPGYYYSPYYDIYLPNISPRVSIKLPTLNYKLLYGGKTLLKEQIEYRFEGQITDKISRFDFSDKATGSPFQKVEYFYDNLTYSVKPTRVKRTDSNGNVLTTIMKRVTEMDIVADSMIMKMKKHNVLSPVMKQINLVNGKLANEVVSCFDVFESNDGLGIGLSQQFLYTPDKMTEYTFSVMDKSMFTYGQTNYLLDKTFEYEQRRNLYLPIVTKNRLEQTVKCYDFTRGQLILDAKNTQREYVAFADIKKYRETHTFLNSIEKYFTLYDYAKHFYDIYPEFDISQQPEEFQEYTRTSGHRMMIELVTGVATRSITHEQVMILVDSLRKNNGKYFFDFLINYGNLIEYNPNLPIKLEHCQPLILLVIPPDIEDPNFFNYLYWHDKRDLLSNLDTIQVYVSPETKCLRLFALFDGRPSSINYTVKTSSKSEFKIIKVLEQGSPFLQVFDIDLRNYENIISVKVDNNLQGCACMVLVPDKVEFEAFSYNWDGSVFCKFNQSGRAEINEYDGVGRLIRVRDQNGRVIKECHYNNILD